MYLYDDESLTPTFWISCNWKWSHFLFWSEHLNNYSQNRQPFPSCTQTPFPFVHKLRRGRAAREEEGWRWRCHVLNGRPRFHVLLDEIYHVRFLAAGGPLRECEQEFMGTCCKLIVTTQRCGVSICLCPEPERGKTSGTMNVLFIEWKSCFDSMLLSVGS